MDTEKEFFFRVKKALDNATNANKDVIQKPLETDANMPKKDDKIPSTYEQLVAERLRKENQ